MLVLQRKVGESICIGQDIEVVVLQVSGGRARLGFRCPGDVPIRRQELPMKSSPGDSDACTPTDQAASGEGRIA